MRGTRPGAAAAAEALDIDIDIDAKRVSLYDVVNSLYPDAAGDSLSRTTLIGRTKDKLNDAKAEAVAGKLQDLHSRALAASEGQKGAVRGFLLLLPTCFAVQIEGEQLQLDDFMLILRDEAAGLGLQGLRVVSATDRVPQSCHVGWNSAFAAGGGSESETEELDLEGAVARAAELNMSFMRLGGQLSTLRAEELSTLLDRISSYWEGMPDASAVMSLQACPLVPTLEDYLDVFTGPINVDLDSEKVWPAPARLEPVE